MAYTADFVPKERMDELQILTSGTFARGGVSAAHFRRSWYDPEPINPNPLSNTFMIVVPMEELPAHGGWLDGRRKELPVHGAGCVGYVDMRACWVAELGQPFETFNFFLPLTSFDELTDEYGGTRIERLSCPFTGETKFDAHALGLVRAMLPLLQRPHEASALFADYIFGATRLHVAVRYGGLNIPERRRGGRLADWQQKRARQMLLDDLSADIGTAEVAAACGLSSRQFERAFRQTFGLPPHRWRLAQRVHRARELINDTNLTFAEIAQRSGFVDQSHLTRVFGAHLKVTPSAYRRERKR
jgi:AraC family transcriptional regulator